MLEASDLGDGHYTAILSAAYFVADGMRHAYVVGFADEPGDQEVFHVSSSDGLAWEIDEDPPFEQLGLELSRPGPIPGSVIQADDGTWVMYLWGIPAAGVFGRRHLPCHRAVAGRSVGGRSGARAAARRARGVG